MGLDRLRAFLQRHRRVGLDTNVFLYQLEAAPRYLPLAGAVFAWLEQPGSKAVTSTITMTELLVAPYRNSDEELVDQVYALLSSYPNLEWIAPTLPIADLAASFRAAHRLGPPDSLQAATAVHAHATGFITNDEAFGRVDAFETLILDRTL